MITFGFVLNERAYLRSGWNVLDFVIVTVSLIGVSASDTSALGSATGAIKTIRVFRAFRPLRVINRAPGLRLIVNAVIESIPDVFNVVAVLIVCFSIFAAVSVNFLKGDLRHCAGDYFDNNIADNSAAMALLESPKAFNDMSSTQQTMLDPAAQFMTILGIRVLLARTVVWFHDQKMDGTITKHQRVECCAIAGVLPGSL